MNNFLSLDEKIYVIEYLLHEGYVNDLKSAENILGNIGQQWLDNILDEEYRNLSRKAGLMTQRAAKLGVESGGARVGSEALKKGGVRNAIRIALGMKPKPRNNRPGVQELRGRASKAAKKAATIAAVAGTHLPGVAQEKEKINREKGKLKSALKTETDREHLENSLNSNR